MSKKIFLSHISEEAKLAIALKQNLGLALDDLEVFVSAVDVHLGEEWLKTIKEALSNADAVVVLCSNNSVRRPWLNFESGGGGARGIPVIPICHNGLKKEELPYPLYIYQGIELNDTDSCKELITRIASLLNINSNSEIDFQTMADNLKPKSHQRDKKIGIVLTHGQAKWDQRGKSIFNLPDSLLPEIIGDIKIQYLKEKKNLLSDELNRFSGLILGNPWRNNIEKEIISALYTWVKDGGRLLLLGFELGDRHHGGNLGELSQYFGIHPCADIVGPHNFIGKPYGLPVNFKVKYGDDHSFTAGLSNVELTNVQTMWCEPGGNEWLRIGDNAVYRPARITVMYHEGILSQPGGTKMEEIKDSNWLPVAVEAPIGLCGNGGVNAIGTWQILGSQKSVNNDNIKMLSRILLWLSGQT